MRPAPFNKAGSSRYDLAPTWGRGAKCERRRDTINCRSTRGHGICRLLFPATEIPDQTGYAHAHIRSSHGYDGLLGYSVSGGCRREE